MSEGRKQKRTFPERIQERRRHGFNRRTKKKTGGPY